ncbi:MAG: hypothetical protein HYY68_04305 [Thaumarchaeota archaeon]|nr:hypothetical protein [Nitrososphaerota archaeon]
MVVGEGAIGYVRGRVYVSGGRKHPVLGPGNKWYPRLRIEMMDKSTIERAAHLFGERMYQTKKKSWLTVRMGKPMIAYLEMIRKHLPGTKGLQTDYVIANGSPVSREIVDNFIRSFR